MKIPLLITAIHIAFGFLLEPRRNPLPQRPAEYLIESLHDLFVVDQAT